MGKKIQFILKIVENFLMGVRRETAFGDFLLPSSLPSFFSLEFSNLGQQVFINWPMSVLTLRAGVYPLI